MKPFQHIYKYLGATILLGSLAACNKLDPYNPSGTTAEAIWTTPEGFVTEVNAAYGPQRNWYGQSEDGVFIAETGTDLWLDAGLSGYARQLVRYDGLTSLQGGANINSWRAIWPGINLCNAGIERIDAVVGMSADEKDKRLGELHFLRGFYYWHVVEQWGNVMLLTTETKEPINTATRSSIDDFYKLIISDLEFAADKLPNSWPEYGRATKKAALGYLAKAYLSRAYYTTAGAGSGEGIPYFTKARDIANQVISRSGEFGVSLYPDFADVFNPANNKTNKEALYVVTTSTNTTLNLNTQYGSRMHLYYQERYDDGKKPGLVNQASAEYGYTQEARLMPTRALLDMFADNDPRYAATFQEVWHTNQAFTWTQSAADNNGKDASVVGRVMVPGVDTALWITRKSISAADAATRPYIVMDRDSIYPLAGGAIRQTGTPNTVRMKKFIDPSGGRPGTQDFITMRLAEMYMISAEAEMQLSNAGVAAQRINEMRARGGSLPQDRTVGAGDINLDFILDERAREFCGENQRWYDLKRTHKLVDRISRLNPNITAVVPEGNPNYTHYNIRPIPQGDLDALLNKDEFKQNPGY